jgi:hypothetical protein
MRGRGNRPLRINPGVLRNVDLPDLDLLEIVPEPRTSMNGVLLEVLRLLKTGNRLQLRFLGTAEGPYGITAFIAVLI